MATHNVCIAVLDSPPEVQEKLQAIRASGVDMQQVSVVGKDHPDDKHVHGYHTTGETMRFWGAQGAMWGGIMGAMAGAGFLFVPGIGPLLMAGPLLSMLIGGIEGGAVLGGMEAVFAGILHLSFTKDSLVLYEKQLKAGKWLLLVHGDTQAVTKAQATLHSAGAGQVAVYAS